MEGARALVANQYGAQCTRCAVEVRGRVVDQSNGRRVLFHRHRQLLGDGLGVVAVVVLPDARHGQGGHGGRVQAEGEPLLGEQRPRQAAIFRRRCGERTRIFFFRQKKVGQNRALLMTALSSNMMQSLYRGKKSKIIDLTLVQRRGRWSLEAADVVGTELVHLLDGAAGQRLLDEVQGALLPPQVALPTPTRRGADVRVDSEVGVGVSVCRPDVCGDVVELQGEKGG